MQKCLSSFQFRERSVPYSTTEYREVVRNTRSGYPYILILPFSQPLLCTCTQGPTRLISLCRGRSFLSLITCNFTRDENEALDRILNIELTGHSCVTVYCSDIFSYPCRFVLRQIVPTTTTGALQLIPANLLSLPFGECDPTITK